MNNSAFLKTMENIRSYKNIKLVTSQKKYAKYVINDVPDFKDRCSCLKALFAAEMKKS